MRSLIPTIAAAAALALLLTGCASGPTANATVVDKAVSIQPSSGDPEPVETTVAVEVGETVATDKVGLSEVVFADKSYTRIGPSSKLKIVELSAADKQRTISSLEVGESWHRVKKLTVEDGTYQVKTPVGTASVRGTAFSVVCTNKTACEFVVIEGRLEVKLKGGTKLTVNPFERLTVPGGTVTPYPVDAVKANAWIIKNLELDGVTLSDAAEAAMMDAWKASVAGVYHTTATVTSSTAPEDPVGAVYESDWTFTAGDCAQLSCSVSISSSAGQEYDGVLSADGLTITASGQTACIRTDTGEILAEKGFDTVAVIALTADSVKDADGSPTVHKFSGTRTFTAKVRNPPDPACGNTLSSTFTFTQSVLLTRVK